MRTYLPNCECGTNNYLVGHEKTVGGWNAAADEYPWSVWFKTGVNGQTCGGSIIADRMILTASHCVTNLDNYNETFKASEFLIYINTANLSDSQKVAKKAIAVHTDPRFLEGILATSDNRTVFYDHDIAVIILEAPIDFSNAPADPKPICLPNIGTLDIKRGMKAEVIGYGLTDVKKNSDIAQILRKETVYVIDVEECMNNIAPNPQNGDEKLFTFDTSSAICTSGKRNDNSAYLSNSDFGGPLSVASLENSKKIQIGIMSGSDKTFDKLGDPIYFYTKVEEHLPFIDYYAKKYNVRWCKPLQEEPSGF